MAEDEAKSLIEQLIEMTGMPAEDVEANLEHLAAQENPPGQGKSSEPMSPTAFNKPPDGWPTLATGELVDIKGIWFEVRGMHNGMLALQPRGPSSALLRRVAKRQKKRGKK